MFNELIRKIKGLYNEQQFPYRRYHKKKRCIFIHIPKVAGTSILEMLSEKKSIRRDHLPWYIYYMANRYYFNSAFKFAFVRNPWDRTLSAYCYLRAGGNRHCDMAMARIISKFNSFDDFVIKGLGEGNFRNHLLFIPQSEFVINGNGKLAIDFLGKYENLKHDYAFVAKQLKIKGELCKKNNTIKKYKDYHDYYNEEKSIKIIGDIYKQDIRLFDYKYSATNLRRDSL
ncbi:MAG: chondroitin 4-O-sulfotransferase [Candidatus Electrothrix sp. AR3]|nr:chondroitin 4-O-sulfotransferase [Candidatus Electrothrix sp. AR3]